MFIQRVLQDEAQQVGQGKGAAIFKLQKRAELSSDDEGLSEILSPQVCVVSQSGRVAQLTVVEIILRSGIFDVFKMSFVCCP